MAAHRRARRAFLERDEVVRAIDDNSDTAASTECVLPLLASTVSVAPSRSMPSAGRVRGLVDSVHADAREVAMHIMMHDEHQHPRSIATIESRTFRIRINTSAPTSSRLAPGWSLLASITSLG
jgi:hypothetical protein